MSKCPRCGTESPPPAVFCMACGSRLRTLVPRGDVRKSVTVVFCDVTGSTHLGEQLDPETLRRVMSRYFDAMRSALEAHGGTVEKFIGDAVMAVFGLPQAHEDDALRAVRAAADMREEVRRLAEELRADFGVEFSARIGVNTGEVMAGDPVAGQAMVTGDAVNVAARLEQAASPGEVLIGASTHRLVCDWVTADPTGPLALKGKAGEIEAYRLGRVEASSVEGRRKTEAPLVGRQDERTQLGAALRGVIDRRVCQSVTIVAPAGTGKSRLVEELLADLPSGTVSLRGRCLPYGDGITYFPIGQVVRQAAGLGDFDPPDEAERRVRAVLDEDEHRDLVCGRVLQLLGIGAAGSPEDTLWAVRRFVEAVARKQPLVLVIDDIHWAESTLLDLIEHIAEWSLDVPLFLLCTARPELLELRPGWGSRGSNSSVLTLEPLTESECELLVAELLGGSPPPAAVSEHVTRAAGGTPLFIEEMVAMLVDDGILEETESGWVSASDLATLGPPPTISALLAARLDRLTEEERWVLDAGAVVGQEFLIGAVRELVPADVRPAALTHLMAMVRKELLRPDRSTVPGEDAFRFRHELVRDAAYDALPKQVRADLHELVAAWMERMAGARIAEQEEIVGYHLEQAHRYRTELSPRDPAGPELATRAGRALANSGRRAYARGDVRAAVSLLGRAARLLPAADEGRLELLPDLAGALEESGDREGATQLVREGLAETRRLGDERLHAHLALAELEHGGEVGSETSAEWEARADARARSSLDIFERTQDLAGQAVARRTLGFVAWSRGRTVEAVGHWERSAALAQGAGDRSGAGHDRAWILIADLFASTPVSELLREGHAALEQLEDVPAARSEVLWTVSNCHAMLGDLDRADAILEESFQIERALGRALSESHFGTQVLAENLHFCGRDAEQVDVLSRGVEQYEAMSKQVNPLLTALLARALAQVGRDEEAWSAARSAREASGGYFYVVEEVLQTEAVVLARRGDHAEALARSHEALDLLRPTDCYWLTADALMTMAQVHRLAGRRPDGAQAAGEALERYEHKGIRYLAEGARRLRTELHGQGRDG